MNRQQAKLFCKIAVTPLKKMISIAKGYHE